jgi:hypothetical protein
MLINLRPPRFLFYLILSYFILFYLIASHLFTAGASDGCESPRSPRRVCGRGLHHLEKQQLTRRPAGEPGAGPHEALPDPDGCGCKRCIRVCERIGIETGNYTSISFMCICSFIFLHLFLFTRRCTCTLFLNISNAICFLSSISYLLYQVWRVEGGGIVVRPVFGSGMFGTIDCEQRAIRIVVNFLGDQV